MVAQQTHFNNGFLKHRMFREQHSAGLKRLFYRQDREQDFERFCRNFHMKRLDTQKGVQQNIWNTEKMYKELIKYFDQ